MCSDYSIYGNNTRHSRDPFGQGGPCDDAESHRQRHHSERDVLGKRAILLFLARGVGAGALGAFKVAGKHGYRIILGRLPAAVARSGSDPSFANKIVV